MEVFTDGLFNGTSVRVFLLSNPFVLLVFLAQPAKLVNDRVGKEPSVNIFSLIVVVDGILEYPVRGFQPQRIAAIFI
jgi:hypothetical protein